VFDVEDKCAYKGRSNAEWREFLEVITTMDVGQSFMIHKPNIGNYRVILSSMPFLLGKTFTTAKEGDGYRVGRVA
jgi:hypothetical protein